MRGPFVRHIQVKYHALDDVGLIYDATLHTARNGIISKLKDLMKNVRTSVVLSKILHRLISAVNTSDILCDNFISDISDIKYVHAGP